MPKAKMVMKQCPKCEQQVPVACKACPCGHMYFQTRKPGSLSKSSSKSITGVASAVKRRRTERLRQVRINQESLRTLTKVSSRTSRPQRNHVHNPPCEESESNVEDNPKKRRGRQKRNSSGDREVEAEREEDVFASIPPEKALCYSIMLAEINRKIGCNSIKI